MTTYFIRTWSFLIAHRINSIVGLILILALGGAIWRMASSDAASESPQTNRHVEVARVSDLMNGGAGLSVVGEVQSKSEAKISPESSGRIVRVNVSLGQTVGAGTILAEIENSSQRAALLQAEGARDAAKASVPNLEATLENAQRGAVNSLLTAYGSIEDAIRDAVDPLFGEPNSSTPVFNVISTTDSAGKSELENKRPAFNGVIARGKTQASLVNVKSDLVSELGRTEEEVRMARNYIDVLVRVLNSSFETATISETELATYKSEANSARASLTTALSSLASARGALEVASNNTSASGTPSNQAAQLKQAEGAYNAALANLEKTRIRAPILGTLNNFDIKLGDTVSPGQQVAVISNNNALEIVAFVTGGDRAKIAVGSNVGIEGGFMGTVIKIAPALDPVTRKIEVRIGLPQEALKELTNGEFIRVELTQTTASMKITGPLRIPISALKMESDRSVVFAVNEESNLVAVPVTAGKLSGGFVEIIEGLAPETEIVADARGLKEGDTVSVSIK